MDYEALAAAVAKEDRQRGRVQPASQSNEQSKRMIQPKNRSASSTQITSEQLLRDAVTSFAPATQSLNQSKPIQLIETIEELKAINQSKRSKFEDSLRRAHVNESVWLRYAAFEAKQSEFARARSIFERALQSNYQSIKFWFSYIDFEISNKFYQHARNLLDRCVTLLPRADVVWYKYVWFEEMCENRLIVRTLFDRWLKWSPDEKVWYAAINFEVRGGDLDHARTIYQAMTIAHHTVYTYLRWARFEERHRCIDQSRAVYELAFKELNETKMHQSSDQSTNQSDLQTLLFEWCAFETRQSELDRARALYRYLIDNSPRQSISQIFDRYLKFEKQFGDQQSINQSITARRKFEYEQEIESMNQPNNQSINQSINQRYEVYFEYLTLLKGLEPVDHQSINQLYERALAQPPTIDQSNKSIKQSISQYFYLWLDYALFTELTMKDYDRVASIYEQALSINQTINQSLAKTNQSINQSITELSAKLWCMYGEYHIRRSDLTSMRRLMGTSIGKCGHSSIFKQYIEVEFLLGNFDRCRKIYEKWCEQSISQSINRSILSLDCWIAYADFEEQLQESERWRGIWELAIQTINQSINQSVNQSINPSVITQSISQLIRLIDCYLSMEVRELARIRSIPIEECEPEDQTIYRGERVIQLFERILNQSINQSNRTINQSINQSNLSTHLSINQLTKYWLEFAQFLLDQKDWESTRQCFERANQSIKQSIEQQYIQLQNLQQSINQSINQSTDEAAFILSQSIESINRSINRSKSCRFMILSAWSEFESAYGSINQQQSINQLMPHTVRSVRNKRDEAGQMTGEKEEYIEYHYSDLAINQSINRSINQSNKLLAAAKAWKQKQAEIKQQSIDDSIRQVEEQVEE